MNIAKRALYSTLGCLVFLLVAGSAKAGICPAIAAATDCGVQINITAQSGGVGSAYTVGLGPSGNGNPYDGVEDTLVGITNTTGATINSITLTASIASDAFGFDGDGACSTGLLPNGDSGAGGTSTCGTATGYEGPGITLSGVSFSGSNEMVTLTFTNGLAAKASAWFSLEGTPSSIITGSSTPEPESLLLLGTGLLAVGFALYRRNA